MDGLSTDIALVCPWNGILSHFVISIINMDNETFGCHYEYDARIILSETEGDRCDSESTN